MLHRRAGRIARPSPSRRLTLEVLEVREVPAAFTEGNLAVYRVGTGSAALSNAATAVFIDEYTPSGTLVQSIAVATSDSGSNQTLTASGTATSEGALSLSPDGQFLVFTGYDAATGTTSIAGTSTGTVVRTIGVAVADGTIDTSTTTTAFSGNNIRGATSTNGTDLWAVGGNTGVVYTTIGSSGAGTVVSNTFANLRTIGVFDSQLYVSSGASGLRIGSVGTGTPTTTGQTTSGIPGFSTTAGSPYGIFFADLDSSVSGVDTLYVADDSLDTIAKYSLVSGSWTATGSVGASGDDFRGITGVVSGTTVTLYATRKGNELVKVVDSTGYNQSLTGTTISSLTTAGTNTAFRGVAFVPKAANQAPVVTLNGGDVSYTENAATPTVLASAATVTDTDSANFDTGTLTVAFGANGTDDDRLAIKDNGTGTGMIGVSGSNVTFGGTTIGTFSGGMGTTALVVTFNANATPVAAQELVRNITFANVSENPSSANRTVNFTLTDGDEGTSDTVSRIVTVTAVNDAPMVIAPTTASTNEDAPLVFSSGNGNAITVSDVDASELSVTLTATNGTLTLGGTSGLTVTGDGTGTVTASGTLSALNAGLNGLTFTPTANYNGSATVVVVANDNGLTGTGGTLSDSHLVNITVNSVNDAPAGTDGSATIDEDTTYTFSAADFGFTDPNDTPANTFAGIVVTTLPVAGTLTRDGTEVSAGDFITADDLLDGLLEFTPAPNANGTAYATFTFQVRDDGGTDFSGENTDQSPNMFTLTVTAVNDAPMVIAPTTASTNEDAPLVFSSGNGNAITVSDVDASELSVTLTATNGALTLGGTSGLTVTGDGTGTVTASGTLSALNAGLNGLTFTPTANFNGSATVVVVANDNGQTGTGGTLTDSETVNVTVNPVNDAPVGASFSVTTDEDAPYTFALSDFQFSDPSDTPANAFAGILIGSTPTAGTLTYNGTAVTSGQFVSANDITAGLLVFTPADDANGTAYASFNFQVRDNGGTSPGVDLDPTARTATINVTAVNDAPIVTLAQATLTVTAGTAFAQDGFAMFAPGGGTDEATQTAQSYTVTPANSALFSVAPASDANGRLTFTASGTTGTTTVTVTVTDSGGAPSAEVAFSVTVETAPVLGSQPVPVNVVADPTARFIAAGADAGSNGTVSLFDARTGTALASFQPFGNFTGGVTVALGDLTGDGTAELVVATRGTIGLLAVYDLATGATLVSPVRPFAGLNTGLQITTADVDGDGVHDLVFSPERGAPTVAGFSFVKGLFVSFANPLPGANLNFQLAAGDVSGDSRAEIVLSANGTLAVLDALGAVQSVIPVVPGFAGEMSVAVGDTNGDGKREIVVALQAPGAATVLAGYSAEGAMVWNLFADTGAGLRRDGTNRPAVPDAPSLAIADVTGDSIADILLGSQTGMGTSRVTVVNGATQQVVRTDLAFGLLSQAGVFTDAG